MEIIGYGILLAIGWYLAPLVIGIIVSTVVLVIAGIVSIFKR